MIRDPAPNRRRNNAHHLHHRQRKTNLQCAKAQRLKIQTPIGSKRADKSKIEKIEAAELAEVGEVHGWILPSRRKRI